MPSPKPNKSSEVVTSLDFFEALRAVYAGERITRPDWGGEDEYAVLRGGWLMLHKRSDSTFHQWMVSEGDMAGTDWIVLGTGATVH